MAVFIAIALTFLVEIVMNGTFFGMPMSSTFFSFWDYLVADNIGVLSSSNLEHLRMGRMGVSYIFISIYLACHLSHLMVGK